MMWAWGKLGLEKEGWLQFVHFIYTGLGEDAAKRADSIIASLRYAGQPEK